jgi:Uma2 family endonuclease
MVQHLLKSSLKLSSKLDSKLSSEPNDSQYFVKQCVTWEQFKTLQSAFAEVGNVRLIYCEGVLEIMGIGRFHELICAMLTGLLLTYFSIKRIAFIPTGAYTQSVGGKTEFQADLSFNFETEKDISDLCIEVVVTSGSTKKLKKYQLRQVPEVWFWEDGNITIYTLKESEYIQTEQSLFLPDLDLRHLEKCLLMDSQLAAMQAFQEKYAGLKFGAKAE